MKYNLDDLPSQLPEVQVLSAVVIPEPASGTDLGLNSRP